MSHQQRPEPQKQALSWTTKPGSTRADSNVGGYWITWMNAGWCVWHNSWANVDGKRINLAAGKKQDCLDACEAHWAKVLSPQGSTSGIDSAACPDAQETRSQGPRHYPKGQVDLV